MTDSVRLDEYVGRAVPVERRSGPRKEPPAWAPIAWMAYVVIAVIAILLINHPMFYGFVGSMVVVAIVAVALDRLVPAWATGYVEAEVDSAQVRFRAQRGVLWLALLYLAALLTAGFFFVGALSAGAGVNHFFLAFGALIVVGIGHAVWMIWTVSRWVEVRLDAEGVSARGPLRRAVTIPWGSVVTAFAPGQKLVLATVSGPVQWPVRQLLSDPDVVAEIIRRCAEQPRPDAEGARAIIDALIAEKRPLR